VAGPWEAEWVGKVGPKGWMSVRAAITVVSRGGTLSDMLRECVAFTGDVDTVAAIAMGAASMSPQVRQDLPKVLYDQLEDGPYGRRYVARLDAELLGRFGFAPPRGESP
jgi:ADP-ribosylglycohydrolase